MKTPLTLGSLLWKGILFVSLTIMGGTLGLCATTAYRYSDITISSESTVNLRGQFICDSKGNLYVFNGNALQQIKPDGTSSILCGTIDNPTGESVDGTGAMARFYYPSELCKGYGDTFYVLDGGWIKKITPDGQVTSWCRTNSTLPTIDGAVATANAGSVYRMRGTSSGKLILCSNFYFKGTTPAVFKQIDTQTGVLTSNLYPDLANQLLALGETEIFNILPDDDGTLLVSGEKGLWKFDATSKLSQLISYASYDMGLQGIVLGSNQPSMPCYTSLVGKLKTGEIILNYSNELLFGLNDQTGLRVLAGNIASVTSLNATDSTVGGAKAMSCGVVCNGLGDEFYINGTSKLIKATPTTTAAVASCCYPDTNAIYGYGSYLSTLALGQGNTYTFSPTISSDSNCSYQWYRDSLLVSTTSTPSLTLSSIAPTDAGSYSVKATNSGGSITFSLGKVSVFSSPITTMESVHTKTGGSFLWGIASNGTRLVSVGTGGTILTSDDGNIWTSRSSGTNNWLVDVTITPMGFMAVGDQGLILTSSDGLSWKSLSNVPTTKRLNKVIYFRDTTDSQDWYWIAGEGGTLMYSNDGSSWTLYPLTYTDPSSNQTTTYTGWLRGLCYLAPTATIAVSGQGGFCAAINASQSTSIYSPSANNPDLEALARNYDTYGAVAIGASGVVETIHLQTWNYSTMGGYRLIFYLSSKTVGVTLSNNYRNRSLCFGLNAYLATGENGMVFAAMSSTGPWVKVPSGTTANLVGSCFTGNRFFCVGENETILRSSSLSAISLANLSSRALASSGDDTLISGFVVEGTHAKTFLVRAAGPGLAKLGVSNTLTNPTLQLYQGSTVIGSAGPWYKQTNASDIASNANAVGAFAFDATSTDAALLISLAPGVYTAMVGTGSQSSGNVLLEFYDCSPGSDKVTRAVNLSTRALVSPESILTSGFVVDGSTSKNLLIRGVGKSLAKLGVANALTKAPKIIIYKYNPLTNNGQWDKWSTYSGWISTMSADAIRAAALQAGAFTLDEIDGEDTAGLFTAFSGIYTIQLVPDGETGVGMLEVYEIP